MSNPDKGTKRDSIPRWVHYGIWILVAVCIALFIFSDCLFRYEGPNLPNHRGEAIKVILTIVAGVAAFYGLWVNHKRVKALDKQIEAMNKQNIIAEKGKVDERFKNAIEHLGADANKSAIVLGGVHSLHRIASERDDYRKTVFDILCSHLRNATKGRAEGEGVTIVEQTILDLLFKHIIGEKYTYKNLVADLTGANLTGAYLTGANLTGAYLTKVNLTEAYLTGASLTEAYLTGANFTGAYLRGANFTRAVFTGANFTEAKLRGAKLTGVHLRGVNFTGAHLKGVNFKETYLGGVIGLKNAILDDSTILPEGFEIPK